MIKRCMAWGHRSTGYSPAEGPPALPNDFEDFCSGGSGGAQELGRAREAARAWAGSDVVVEELAHGSSGMLSFVIRDGNAKFFLKMARKVSQETTGQLRREHDNIRRAAGSGVTAAPLFFDAARAAMICPFVEGTRLSLTASTDSRVIAQVMREVGKMHACPVVGARPPEPDFEGGLSGVLAGIEGALPELAACARGAARTLDCAYRRLAPASPALVHGDLHFGNILEQPNHEVRLIDFFATRVGDPAGDLAQWMLISGMDIGRADELVRLRQLEPPADEAARVRLTLAGQHLHFSCRMARHLKPNAEARYFFDSLRHDLYHLGIGCDLGAMQTFMYPADPSRRIRGVLGAVGASWRALVTGAGAALGAACSAMPRRLRSPVG